MSRASYHGMPQAPTCRKCGTAHWSGQGCPRVIEAEPRPVVERPKPKALPAPKVTTTNGAHELAATAKALLDDEHAHIPDPTMLARWLLAKDAERKRKAADATKRWRDKQPKGQ
jgi:hypothetical protein